MGGYSWRPPCLSDDGLLEAFRGRTETRQPQRWRLDMASRCRSIIMLGLEIPLPIALHAPFISFGLTRRAFSSRFPPLRPPTSLSGRFAAAARASRDTNNVSLR